MDKQHVRITPAANCPRRSGSQSTDYHLYRFMAKRGDAVVNVEAKWGLNTKALKDYDVITDPGQYYELDGRDIQELASSGVQRQRFRQL